MTLTDLQTLAAWHIEYAPQPPLAPEAKQQEDEHSPALFILEFPAVMPSFLSLNAARIATFLASQKVEPTFDQDNSPRSLIKG